jgi:putative oxidoreductase
MTLRVKLSVLAAPIPLRIMLGVIFIWAGLGKIIPVMQVEGEQAATLANMGAIHAPAPASGQAAGTVSTAADFTQPVEVRRLMMLAVMLHDAANPVAKEGSPPPRRIWPKFLAGGRSPVVLAWMVALTELLGGCFVLVGLLTRVAATGIACVMLGAMWLAVIGPAVQSGQTGFLGLLPDYGVWEGEKWMGLCYQFALLAAAVSLVLSGPGIAALDNLLFRRKGAEAD